MASSQPSGLETTPLSRGAAKGPVDTPESLGDAKRVVRNVAAAVGHLSSTRSTTVKGFLENPDQEPGAYGFGDDVEEDNDQEQQAIEQELLEAETEELELKLALAQRRSAKARLARAASDAGSLRGSASAREKKQPKTDELAEVKLCELNPQNLQAHTSAVGVGSTLSELRKESSQRGSFAPRGTPSQAPSQSIRPSLATPDTTKAVVDVEEKMLKLQQQHKREMERKAQEFELERQAILAAAEVQKRRAADKARQVAEVELQRQQQESEELMRQAALAAEQANAHSAAEQQSAHEAIHAAAASNAKAYAEALDQHAHQNERISEHIQGMHTRSLAYLHTHEAAITRQASLRENEEILLVGKVSSMSFTERISKHFDYRPYAWFNRLLFLICERLLKLERTEENYKIASKYAFENLNIVLVNFKNKEKINRTERLLRSCTNTLNKFKNLKEKNLNKIVIEY